jgi:hypothetical protein
MRMPSIARAGRFGLVLLLAAAFAACSGQKEAAHQLLAEIDATVTAASTEAAKYVPDQLMDVQTKFGGLKASFDRRDYAAVVNGAPAVLDAAQTLATAAAAKKDEVLKAQNDQWTSLAATLPDSLSALRNRIDELRKPSNKRLAAGMNLDAVRMSLDEAASLWSKAQAAFAGGNMDEAVRTAQDVKVKVSAAAAALKMDLGSPAG